MICISKNEEFNTKDNSKPKDKKESQYLLRVVYDTEDTKVHKLLEGIFGEDQMLDVKNGKIAKISSTLTPKERDCFFEMISETLNKISEQDDETDDDEEDADLDEIAKENKEKSDLDEIPKEDEDLEDIVIERITPKWKESHEETIKENKEIEDEITSEEKEDKNSRKVSAEKLIEEFASFLNSIS